MLGKTIAPKIGASDQELEELMLREAIRYSEKGVLLIVRVRLSLVVSSSSETGSSSPSQSRTGVFGIENIPRSSEDSEDEEFRRAIELSLSVNAEINEG
jgi:hypothetical protein